MNGLHSLFTIQVEIVAKLIVVFPQKYGDFNFKYYNIHLRVMFSLGRLIAAWKSTVTQNFWLGGGTEWLINKLPSTNKSWNQRTLSIGGFHTQLFTGKIKKINKSSNNCLNDLKIKIGVRFWIMNKET